MPYIPGEIEEDENDDLPMQGQGAGPNSLGEVPSGYVNIGRYLSLNGQQARDQGNRLAGELDESKDNNRIGLTGSQAGLSSIYQGKNPGLSPGEARLDAALTGYTNAGQFAGLRDKYKNINSFLGGATNPGTPKPKDQVFTPPPEPPVGAPGPLVDPIDPTERREKLEDKTGIPSRPPVVTRPPAVPAMVPPPVRPSPEAEREKMEEKKRRSRRGY